MSDIVKSKAKKKKPKKKNSKRLSTDAVQKYEPLIQDRIAGMPIKDLAEKYGLHRDTVSTICSEHRERIEVERSQYLADRQERILQAMDQETETIVRLIGKHSRALERFVDQVHVLLDKSEQEDRPMNTEILFDGWKEALKGVDKLRASILAQQKESSAK